MTKYDLRDGPGLPPKESKAKLPTALHSLETSHGSRSYKKYRILTGQGAPQPVLKCRNLLNGLTTLYYEIRNYLRAMKSLEERSWNDCTVWM